jgi:hypothetical protein
MGRNLSLGLVLFLIALVSSSCNNDGKAQEDFTESFSGSFQSGSIVTDTNDDGVPANSAVFEGNSTLGPVSIQSLNEFTAGDSPLGDCPEGNTEFTLVRGNFVKRFDQSGDLLFGTWDQGISCFDPNTNISEATQTGFFSGGTGQFVGASGSIQIHVVATFLATNIQQGYTFGGATGTGDGVIE